MANDRSLGLSELARFGFVDLSGTIGKLDELVKLVGCLLYTSDAADE